MPFKDAEKQREARRAYEKKRSAERRERKEFWLFVFYPESAPENWRDIITGWHVECLVSPLHDRDVNPDGTLKKPHYHGIVFFDSMKTFVQAQELVSVLKGPLPIRPNGSKRTACRYLIHADNPEKAQYDKNDISSFGGALYDSYSLHTDDILPFVEEMMAWVDKYECYSYRLLMQYAKNERKDWLRTLVLSPASNAIRNYLKSSFAETVAMTAYSKYTLEEIIALENEDSKTDKET